MQQFIIEVGKAYIISWVVNDFVEGAFLIRTTTQLRVGEILAHKGTCCLLDVDPYNNFIYTFVDLSLKL